MMLILHLRLRLIYFNSIKVRLELNIFGDYGCCYSHFNSIKVRLELEEAGLNPNLLMKFQFHKGAIRTIS